MRNGRESQSGERNRGIEPMNVIEMSGGPWCHPNRTQTRTPLNAVLTRPNQPLHLPFTPDRPLLHVHIPKCGGMSVDRLLVRAFPVGGVRRLEHHPDRIADNLIDLGRHACYSGHVAYRFRDHLPAETAAFTFLRDPVDRAVSAFHYFRWLGPTGLAAAGASPALFRSCELSLLDFLKAEPDAARANLGNVQTWMLSRTDMPSETGDPLTAGDLAIALQALGEMAFVGLTEQFDESIAGLCRRCGWPAPDAAEHVNRTPGRPRLTALDPATLAAVRELTALDAELYRYAEARFADPRPEPLFPTPSDKFEVTFGGPIPGGGWYDRETNAGGYFCWTRRAAWVEGRVGGSGPLRVTVDLAGAVDVAQIEQFEVRVNGQQVPLTRSPLGDYGTRVTGEVEAAPHQGDRYRVEVRVPHTVRPCDSYPGSTDPRELGVAVSRMELSRPEPPTASLSATRSDAEHSWGESTLSIPSVVAACP